MARHSIDEPDLHRRADLNVRDSAGPAEHGSTKGIIKRLIDLVIALALLPFCLPLMVVVALLTLAAHGRPVLFSQARVARGGRTFTLLKFRTMTDARDENGELLPDEFRMTGAGNFMRRFRVDELPGIFAVLKGDLSFVGPRPLPPYVLKTIAGSERRHMVKPGFTGLAQVSGATLLTNKEKLAVDLYYIRHWSLTEDFRILLKTVDAIVRGERRDEALIARALAEESKPLPRTSAHSR